MATVAGLAGQARLVGYALHALPATSTVPWHRVINAQGRISRDIRTGAGLSQRLLLEREGVPFDAGGRVPLTRVAWKPRETPKRTRRV